MSNKEHVYFHHNATEVVNNWVVNDSEASNVNTQISKSLLENSELLKKREWSALEQRLLNKKKKMHPNDKSKQKVDNSHVNSRNATNMANDENDDYEEYSKVDLIKSIHQDSHHHKDHKDHKDHKQRLATNHQDSSTEKVSIQNLSSQTQLENNNSNNPMKPKKRKQDRNKRICVKTIGQMIRSHYTYNLVRKNIEADL